MTIRVLVVDDSSFVRRAVSRMLATDDEIAVVGHAANGAEVLDLIRASAPDVVTLDLQMPRVSGLEILRRIMSDRPTPVVLLSSFAQSDAAVTLEALSAGAVDFVDKSSVSPMDVYALAEELIRKIKAAARSHPRPMLSADLPPPSTQVASLPNDVNVVVVGASTGGPPAIQLLLSRLPRDFGVPILVVQHMPAAFTRAFAERLGTACLLDVKEVAHGDLADGGRVLVAAGGRHFGLRRGAGGVEAVVGVEPRGSVHVPSVDVTATAAVSMFGRGTCLVVLTGMGNDGLEGARAVRAAGGVVITQSEATCVVHGMPRAVAREGLASATLAIDEMVVLLARLARRRSARSS